MLDLVVTRGGSSMRFPLLSKVLAIGLVLLRR